ncbi:MAG: response regulator [Zavarzinella sp.]|nr:response regulator [Zavarzinella sp.]
MSTSPAPPTVLVVEDNMDTADSIARFLRVAAGFSVRVAYDGAAGVKAALAEKPTAVVCDISLPRLNGLQVANQLSGLNPRQLLIAVTAYDGAYTEELAYAAGFDHYIVKPADPFALESIVQDHVRRLQTPDLNGEPPSPRGSS